MFYMMEGLFDQINIAGSGAHIFSPSQLSHMPQDISRLVPENFHLDIPVNLMFYTCHAQDSDANLIVLQASFGQCLYFVNHTEEYADFSQIHRLHHHDFYELMFVIDGTVYQNIEHQRHLYPAGSCCLLNRNVYHTEEYRSSYRVVFLQLSSEFVASLLTQASLSLQNQDPSYKKMENFFQQDLSDASSSDKKYIDFIPRKSEAWIIHHVHGYFEKLLLQTQNPTPSSCFYFQGILLDLLCCLFNENYFQKTPIHFGTTAERNLFDAITRYLIRCHGHVSRKELEAQFHYSGDYLYKIVQKYTGLSIFGYGMKFCLKEAAELLSATSLSISDICARLGFTNQTHFYRLFKEEYHMTPKAWRKAARAANAAQNPPQSVPTDKPPEDPADP